jgi:hypothetical protein
MALVKFSLSGTDVYINPDKVVMLVQQGPDATDVVLLSNGTLPVPFPIAQVAAAIDAGA